MHYDKHIKEKWLKTAEKKINISLDWDKEVMFIAMKHKYFGENKAFLHYPKK